VGLVLALVLPGCGSIPGRVVSERRIAQIDSGFIEGSLTVSRDIRRIAYLAQDDDGQFTVIDGKKEKHYDATASLVFSPDSHRVAYFAQTGDKWFAIVDGVEGKHYDAAGGLVFSPDSQRLAYFAQAGDDWFVIVGGIEGKHYSGLSQGSIAFDSASSLHYLALDGSKVYLVEETLE
jgi:hypothetical protein